MSRRTLTVKLSPREQEVLRLRDEERLSFEAIGEALGVSKYRAHEAYRRAQQKAPNLGKPVDRKGDRSVEATNPGKAAALIDKATDPGDERRVMQLAEACGLPKPTAEGLVKRLRTRYMPVAKGLKSLKTKELQALLDDRLWRTLHYLDDVVLAQATAKELAIAAGILVDKRQLLRGEPTEILSVDDRRQLHELAAAIYQELEKRRMTVDTTPAPQEAPRVINAPPGGEI